MFWILLILVLLIVLRIHSRQQKREALRFERSKIEKMRRCPACAERIQLAASICRYCGTQLASLTNEEIEEIDSDYLKKIEAIDPDASLVRQANERKAKNAADWENNT